MSKTNPFISMMDLDCRYSASKEEKIAINKVASKIQREAREKAKTSTCAICGKECTSFCKSHSVPCFSLRNIAENGKVAQVLQGDLPLVGNDAGLNNAGTFHLICRECDSFVFQEYENPTVYSQQPTERIMAQIALKNELQTISKRNQEVVFYDLLEKKFDNYQSIGTGKTIEELDLAESWISVRYATKSLSENKKDRYRLCFYRLLDYVVPVATQAAFALIGDLEDGIVNNVYNISEQYRMAMLHIAVLPLEKTSVVLLFVECGVNRYRKFIRQLHKLEPEDQLAAINYMAFAYTENIFLRPSVYKTVKENVNFMGVCRMTSIAETPFIFANPIKVAVEEFSFSKRKTIPNLLGEEFAIKRC